MFINNANGVKNFISTVFVFATLSSCNVDDEGKVRVDPKAIAETVAILEGQPQQYSSLSSTAIEPVGGDCQYGGMRVETGFDRNRDNLLQPDEVDHVDFHCYGVEILTESSYNGLLKTSEIPKEPGSDCVEGGIRLETGLDLNNDEALQADEITDSKVVCHGEDSANAKTSLVSLGDLEGGGACALGGLTISHGLDVNQDQILQAEEVDNTHFLCRGANGVQGYSTLLASVVEPKDSVNCLDGGLKVTRGLDRNRNQHLDDDEVTLTHYVCEGAQGSKGSQMLLVANPVTAGASDIFCPYGGLELSSGLDTNQDGVLQADEITSQEMVCQGEHGVEGESSLIVSHSESAGANCALGGLKLDYGVDTNKDGSLQIGEIQDSEYVCHGADGSVPVNSLIASYEEEAGEHCDYGGYRVENGLDTNRNDVLDKEEVQQFHYVCQGEEGAQGYSGIMDSVTLAEGHPDNHCGQEAVKLMFGKDLNRDDRLTGDEIQSAQVLCHGAKGETSKDNTLILTENVLAGSEHCEFGGIKIDSGTDFNHNGALDPEEIPKSQYICRGVSAENGGVSLVQTTEEAPGDRCTEGGVRFDSGLDQNGDGNLSASEWEQTHYVCHGGQGVKGLNTLIATQEIDAGHVECASGGIELSTGLDDNGDGELESGEVNNTQYICQGAIGETNDQGNNSLAFSTVEPKGDHCGLGGVKLQNGLDTNGNKILESSEVEQTQYLCECTNVGLSQLGIDGTSLTPSFAPLNFTYEATINYLPSTAQLTVAGTVAEAQILINGQAMESHVVGYGFDVGENALNIDVEIQGCPVVSYGLTVQRDDVAEFAAQAYLKASNAGAGDNFHSVDLSADGNTMVVGAYSEKSSFDEVVSFDSQGSPSDPKYDDDLVNRAGAVYVFEREVDLSWKQTAYLKANNVGESGFGFLLDLSEDGENLAVSAMYEDSGSTDSGAVYVFVKEDNQWQQQEFVKASNVGKTDRFGSSIQLEGDTLVVGAYVEDSSVSGIQNGNVITDNNSSTDSGAVYVFNRSETTWTQTAYLKGPSPKSKDYYGIGVALYQNWLAVGAMNEDSRQSDSGAVFMYRLEDNQWVYHQTLKARNVGRRDGFGVRVAMHSDWLAIGAYREDSEATDSGAIYMFQYSEEEDRWEEQQMLTDRFARNRDYFGLSVDMTENLLVVGSYSSDLSLPASHLGVSLESLPGPGFTPDSGSAYLFEKQGASWVQRAFIKAPNAEKRDYFGRSVAIAQDGTVAVGAFSEDNGSQSITNLQESTIIENSTATDSGAVYIYQ